MALRGLSRTGLTQRTPTTLPPGGEALDAGHAREMLSTYRAHRCHRVVRRPSLTPGLCAVAKSDSGRAVAAVRLLLGSRRRQVSTMRGRLADDGACRRSTRKPHESVPS